MKKICRNCEYEKDCKTSRVSYDGEGCSVFTPISRYAYKRRRLNEKEAKAKQKKNERDNKREQKINEAKAKAIDNHKYIIGVIIDLIAPIIKDVIFNSNAREAQAKRIVELEEKLKPLDVDQMMKDVIDGNQKTTYVSHNVKICFKNGKPDSIKIDDKDIGLINHVEMNFADEISACRWMEGIYDGEKIVPKPKRVVEANWDETSPKQKWPTQAEREKELWDSAKDIKHSPYIEQNYCQHCVYGPKFLACSRSNCLKSNGLKDFTPKDPLPTIKNKNGIK